MSVTNLPRATEKIWSDLYDDCAGAMSAVLATRKDVKQRIPDAVYLKGNKWNKKVAQFKVDAFGMSDYNSSDLILEYSKGEKKDQFKQKFRMIAIISIVLIGGYFLSN